MGVPGSYGPRSSPKENLGPPVKILTSKKFRGPDLTSLSTIFKSHILTGSATNKDVERTSFTHVYNLN
jgi:hypothetical protein